MKNILRSAFVTGSIALLCACGAKGPLFMPEDAPPVEASEAAVADDVPLEEDAEAQPSAPVDDAVDGEVEPEPEEAPAPPDGAG